MNIFENLDGTKSPVDGQLAAPLDPDPVLAGLDLTRNEYLHVREGRDLLQSELAQAQAELQTTDEIRRQMEEELEDARAQLQRSRKLAERQTMRADRMAAALKSIHRALFDGNVYELLLKACMQITRATRGLYITGWDGGRFRVRAAIEIDGYPKAPVSPYLEALCRRVIKNGESVLCNGDECRVGLPEPKEGETFRNLLVAPAVLLKDFNGFVLLADKIGGDFEPDDAEVVLAVGDQASVAIENQRLQADLIHAYFSIVGVLADAVETKDSYTHGHCELVARLARLTAERLGMSDLECSVAFYGGLLHDVGKIGISDGILNKPGKLTPEEWDLMRSHVRMGRDLLDRVPMLNRVAEVVMHHHERFDGAGYPDGLQGEDIPICARVVGAVDAYCAMIARRSYKESFDVDQARAELLRCQGGHFDPRVVKALLSILDEPELLMVDPHTWDPPAGLSHPADFRHLMQAKRA